MRKQICQLNADTKLLGEIRGLNSINDVWF